ncbi:hypothetical protein HMN09_00158400 [Mycena chlorophos]|uniref:Uncharacterized protein n=1 Tax=Mycena chlorophos TaxID=658473 RepID=A0A8H6TQ32_MYCCL|nr:hypothetical protein HMN09_00158400 [Mycena chlorophos]
MQPPPLSRNTHLVFYQRGAVVDDMPMMAAVSAGLLPGDDDNEYLVIASGMDTDDFENREDDEARETCCSKIGRANMHDVASVLPPLTMDSPKRKREIGRLGAHDTDASNARVEDARVEDARVEDAMVEDAMVEDAPPAKKPKFTTMTDWLLPGHSVKRGGAHTGKKVEKKKTKGKK